MKTCFRSSFFWAVFLLLLSLAFVLPAQPESRYLIRQYSIENGLPQNSAHRLVLDRNDFLWIATQGGLCRFDGRRFLNYNNKNSVLPTDRIKSVAIDAQGKVLILMPKTDQVFYVDERYRLQRDQSPDQSNSIFIIGSDAIKCDSVLLCTDAFGGQRIFRLRQDDFSRKVNTIASNDHELYISEKDSLFWVDVRGKQFRGYAIRLHAGPVISGHLLTFDDHWDPIAWNGPEQVRQLRMTSGFSTLQARLRQYPATKISAFGNAGGTIGLIRFRQEIWGLKLSDGCWDAFLLYSGFDPELDVNSLCYDEHNRILFIGTRTEGFYVVRKNPFRTVLFDKAGSPKNNIYALLRFDEHSVIDYNFQYDPVRGSSRPLPVSTASPALFKSSDGRIWYATKDTLYAVNSAWVTLQKIPLPSSGIWVRALLEDEHHTIWVCTDKALGYIRGNSLQRIALDPSFFSSNDCTTIFAFDQDRIWLGTSSGIQVYHKRTGKTEAVYLESHNIRSIYRAKDGSIWVSTYGKGIYKYVSGKWVPLPLDVEQHLLFAHYFVEDGNGFFWIPTNNGLFQCKKQALDAYARQPGKTAIYYYRHKNAGAYTNEFNGGYGQSFAWFDRLLLLPSLKGVVCFDPMAVQPLLPNGEILIEEINANGNAISQRDHFTLPPGNQRLEINVAAPYFGDEQNIILEYQLKEISERWLPLRERTIAYNSLPDGDYHLAIRKRIGFGSGDYAYKKIQFVIRPFWYETVWFWLAVVGCLAGIIYLLVRRRIRSLQRARLELERKVVERTAELNLSEQQLGQINKVQEQALAIILHDIRSPLKYLSVWARNFNRKLQQLSTGEIIEYSNSLVLSTESISKLSNDLAQWLIFNRDNQKMKYVAINIPELLQEIKKLYDEIVALSGNIIIVELGANVLVADRDKLYLIIRNLVDNAAKHCQGGRIMVSALSGTEHVVFTVADTGNGMTDEELHWWQHYETASPDFDKEKLGLSMVRYFVQLMNGQFQINSAKGKGTTVTVILPALPLHPYEESLL